MQVHIFFPGDHRTWNGAERLCESCGGIESDRVHELPEQPEEARLLDARKLGEVE